MQDKSNTTRQHNSILDGASRIAIFAYPLVFDAIVRDIAITFGMERIRMVWLYEMVKIIEDIFICFDRILERETNKKEKEAK